MNGNNRQTPYGDGELQEKITSMNWKALFFGTPAFALLVLSIVLGFAASAAGEGSEEYTALGLSAVGCFVAFLVFTLCYMRAKRQIKAFIGEHVTRKLLAEVFEVEEYDGKGFMKKPYIVDSGLIHGWDECGGSDYLRGKYKGYNILFSDTTLYRVTETTDSDGDRSTIRDRIFVGQWMVIRHDRHVSTPLRLRDKAIFKTGARIAPNDIVTDNAAFNTRFQIESDGGQGAHLVLTPQFMDFLLNAEAKTKGYLLICFEGSSVHIGIHNNSNAFEPTGRQLRDIESLRRAHRADIKYLTDILDELMRNEFLFQKKR